MEGIDVEEFPCSDKRPVSFGITQNATVDYPTSALLIWDAWSVAHGCMLCFKKGKLDSISTTMTKKAAVAYQWIILEPLTSSANTDMEINVSNVLAPPLIAE